MLDLKQEREKFPDFIQNPNPEVYFDGNYVVLDFETTTIGRGLALYPDNSIICASWRCGPDHPSNKGRSVRPMRTVVSNEFGMSELARDISRARFVICHNSKFEYAWLDRCGVDTSKVLTWDTMLAEYVIGGNRWTYARLSLENTAKRWGLPGKESLVAKMIKDGVDTRDIPISWLTRYCERDVRLTEQIFEMQRSFVRTKRPRLLPLIFTRCLMVPVLADMETLGLKLQEEKVTQWVEEKERRCALLKQELTEMAGGLDVDGSLDRVTILYEMLGFDEVTDRKGNPVRTPTGRPKTDADTISALRARTKEQRTFLEKYTEYKELYSELTKYLRKFKACCDEANGVLKAVFNQGSTATHRLSSSGLDYATQLQNLPRAYKELFRARLHGWKMGESDGAQLEFRVAAHLGRDAVAVQSIRDKVDVHMETAGIIGCSRHDAKPHTFKPLYYGRFGTPEQMRYYEYFREKYKGISDTQERWINGVLRDKYIETEYGMVYYFPDTHMTRSGFIVNSPSICNYPVQGFATAEIIPITLVYMWYYLRYSGRKSVIVNTVHDSVIGEIPPGEEEEWVQVSKHCFIDETYNYLRNVYSVNLTVPLGCGVKIGDEWGKGEEIKIDAEEEYYV